MDHDAIYKLLSIEEKSRNHPKLKAIHDKVLNDLHEAAAVVEKQAADAQKPKEDPKPLDREAKTALAKEKSVSPPVKTPIFPSLNPKAPGPGDA